MAPAAPNPCQRHRRGGVTLLEVLIACGLLVVGLSTMAALLPAAGSRFAQASLEDRAGAVSANALAEIFNRGLVAADCFPPADLADPDGARVSRTLAIGSLLGQLPAYGSLANGVTSQAIFTVASDAGSLRCGSPRSFQLDDELVYTPPQFLDSPTNAFFTASDGSLGPRRFREGVCWGALVAPKEYPPEAGAAAVLSIAVFKKDGILRQDELEAGLAVVLQRRASYYEADITPSGTLLRPCTWLLAIPPSPDAAPRWFEIISAWTPDSGLQNSPDSRKTRLILKQQDDFQTFTGTLSSGSSAVVFAFEGLVRVDEHPITLQ